MHRFLLRLLTLIAIALGFTFHIYASNQTTTRPGKIAPRAGVIRVKMQPDVAKSLGHKAMRARSATEPVATAFTPINEALEKIKTVEIVPAFPYNPKYATARAKYGIDQWYEIRFDESIAPEEAAHILSGTPGVIKANVKKPMRLIEGNGPARVADIANALSRSTLSATPFNDPRLPAQWHYNNDGSIGSSRAGADINLFEAWKKCTGSSKVMVAIIDGGIDYTHEDLAANMFVNEAELNGLPGVDDDDNGLYDDVYGYNFCTNSGEIYPHSHGTHVAGTVAAVNNNGIGVAGVAGGNGTPNSGVKMLSCQVFDSRSGIANPEGDFAMALVYAAECGAVIAQCSWGWGEPNYYEPDVIEAVHYFTDLATDERPGGLCIFAAGNDGATGNFYPGCMPEVLTVAAMTADLRPASYSNFGSWVDVVAPGGDTDYNQALGVLSTLPSNRYGYMDGTSMATPHVSGIAALVLSANPDLPAASLRQQIETSVNDFYATNPDARGLFGNGYVDAAKALQMSDGSAPEPVADFTMQPAQDNITISWVIPASSDDNVNQHLLYYSTTPFTATSSLTSIPTKLIDTKFFKSGETFTYELTGLQALTTYYLALVAIDRWGNRSEMSPVKQATTNAGPEMSVDAKSLTLFLSPSKPQDSKTFNIVNSGEGLLRWSYVTRTTSVTVNTLSTSSRTGEIVPFSGKASGEKIRTYERVNTAEYTADDYPREFNYIDEFYAYIGETDRSLPNSMAQHFTVDADAYPDGFNLTAVSCFSAYGKNPTVEIYKGNAMMSDATRMVSWQPSAFVSEHVLNLPEQIYFAPGESFWVAIHFDAQDELYPLSIALTESTSPSATNSFMSNDLGRTWSKLSSVLADTHYSIVADKVTWGITAISRNPDWSTLISLDPENGTVAGNSTQSVAVMNDGQPLCNGSYALAVYFNTNETAPSGSKLPVTIIVNGQKPKIEVKKVVDFGSLLVGQSKTIEVEVYNQGYGAFAGSRFGTCGIYSENIASTNPVFKGPDYIGSAIAARSTARFSVTFTPTSEGSHSGQIVISDINGYSFKILVQGTATDPARIETTPNEIDLGEIDDRNNSTECTFAVKNTGHYPLQFAFPKFSDEQIEGFANGSVHRFGYSWIGNLGDTDNFTYTAPSELLDAIDVTSQLGDSKYFTSPVEIGFKFPYYGKTYDKLYIHSFGGVCFDTYHGGMMFSPLDPKSYGVSECGFICAFGFELAYKPTSHVRYGHRDGKFVVEYNNVLGIVYSDQYTPISFRLELSPNGDIEIFYDDYDYKKMFAEGRFLYCGIDNFGSTDPLSITNIDIADPEWGDEVTTRGSLYKLFGTGTAIKFLAPAPDLVHGVSPSSGILSPGESVEVKAVVKATPDMNAGPTHTNLVINSNDPLSPSAIVRFNATVTGDHLLPVLGESDREIDFGSVMRTTSATRSLAVHNNGRNAMTITSATTEKGLFNIALETPAKVAPGQSKDVLITLPTTTEGDFTDILTVVTDAGELTTELHGIVTGRPEIATSYKLLEGNLMSGLTEKHPLTVTNTGNEVLNYYITTGDKVSYTPPLDDDAQVRYSFEASIDDNTDVKFQWIDIDSNGRGEQNNFTYYMGHDYVEVDLPFEFPYFGKKYNKMYVYNTGFVSFTKRADEKIWPEPPSAFPGGTVYTNVIAPYWGLHSMDVSRSAGTFHYADSEQAVVSWIEYGNSMNYGVCFQLVMKKDGSFKFNYKAKDKNSVIFGIFGCAGISDNEGRGIRLADRYVQFGDAVQFHPITELSLSPGKSAEADIEINTVGVMAGEYNSSITLHSNVPGNETLTLPVHLIVNGTPKPVIPSSVSEEHIKGYASTDNSDWFVRNGCMYAAYVNIANEGSANFKINSIDFTSPTYTDPYFGFEMQAFNLYYPTADGSSWRQYQKNSSPAINVGASGVKLAVPMTASEINDVPGVYTCNLVLHINADNNDYEVPVTVTFNITEIPELTLDKTEIRIANALPDYDGDESVTITNTGLHRLDYSFYLDPSGNGLSTKAASMYIANKSEKSNTTAGDNPGLQLSANNRAQLYECGNSDEAYNLPSKDEFDYIRGLYYPIMDGASTYYAYGSGNTYTPFSISTQFTAPADDGFNITHIYAWINFDKYENIDLTATIIGGDSPEGENVLGRGTYHLGAKVDKGYPVFVIIPLDRPVYLSPSQDVCVVIDFPAGVEFPAPLLHKEESVTSNRYMAYTADSGWYDAASLFKDQYGSLGYVVACIETVEGSAWSRLLNDTTEGSLEPGESTTVTLHMNASLAPLDTNRSMLVIQSNDPQRQIVNFPVILSKNAAPVINADTYNIIVNEGSSVETAFTVTDPEGDDVSVTIIDNGGMATLLPADSENSANTYTVRIEAEFGDEGNYSFTIEATDSKGNVAEKTVKYTVAHVNRPPVAVNAQNINLTVGATSDVLLLNNLFEDADGDVLTFKVSANNDKVTLFHAGDKLIILANEKGLTSVTVTATDPSAASATNKFTVLIDDTQGIDDVLADNNGFSVYPNPATDVMNVCVGDTDDTQLTIALYSLDGSIVASQAAQPGATTALHVSHVAPGNYMLVISSPSGYAKSRIVIKK